MTDFWCSVILKTGIWLALFSKTASELFTPEIAAVFVERAERIAASLKLAMFFRLGSSASD